MGSLKHLALILGFSSQALAGVFSDGVKFFDEGSTGTPRPVPEKTIEQPKTSKFSWSEQLDIEKDQFFKEGDYTPPAPFIEALRRPTKENILNFEKWQAMRNLLLQRYETARAQYVQQNGVTMPKAQAQVTNVDEQDIEKYHYVFYFESTCPSCHAMFQTINEMVQRGVYVEAVRVDKNSNEVQGLNIPWTFANPEELKKLNLKAVPVLVAIDEKTKKAYQMTGRKSIKQILQVISQGKNSG